MHIDTLEQKIKEKDKLLLELSSINQELFHEMSELQKLLALSKQECEVLMHENANLKSQILEKTSVMTQQETAISKLRNSLTEATNVSSVLYEEKSFNGTTKEYLVSQVKSLQRKYDSREDLVISLQDERVRLLNEIDKIRMVNLQNNKNLEYKEREREENIPLGDYQRVYEEVLIGISKITNCENFEQVLEKVSDLVHMVRAFQNTVAKVKRYFHLNPNTSLEELDRYVVNLIL